MVEPLFDVGLHLMHDGSSWVVTSIDNSGSAAAAGVMPGDVLSHINGNSVATLTSRQISALLRGTAGSHCSLSLWRNTVGGSSAHLEARVQRRIPSHPESFSPRELPELARSSRSPLHADPDDSDPDAEAKLHAQLSQISQRLDEMEQKIRTPNVHSSKLLTSATASNTVPASHPVTATAASGVGNAVFSLKSPSRPRPGLRVPSTSTSTLQSTMPQSPSRSLKPSAAQLQRSPAVRSALRPSSASASSPSKFSSNVVASLVADHETPTKSVVSSFSSVVDNTRMVKSNLFSSHANSLESPSSALASAAAAPTDTFRSNSQASPVRQSREQEQSRPQAHPRQQSTQSTPPRDQQQPLQLQQLLQKLMRQVEDAERQRLVRAIFCVRTARRDCAVFLVLVDQELDSLRATDERRRQDTVPAAACSLPPFS